MLVTGSQLSARTAQSMPGSVAVGKVARRARSLTGEVAPVSVKL